MKTFFLCEVHVLCCPFSLAPLFSLNNSTRVTVFLQGSISIYMLLMLKYGDKIGSCSVAMQLKLFMMCVEEHSACLVSWFLRSVRDHFQKGSVCGRSAK
ncbi:hypothetical protein DUNSADRAFT_12058 [Dunaliella salina]|uniref:Secreted protein n=1 Tax=Dunaliella salina TaxID=3046 RepID=A0ABQ7GC30_DUNSA|nr:hypothetical protein DUNSADRAFT_12058 [Dunaliella salina]|eukprot:KAF5832157.1 hypothetical protein DUNSADRAFT_12058 [Dunaliella salina]